MAPPLPTVPDGQVSALSDEDVVQRILAGEPALFEIVMRRHNQQLYRAARAILRGEADVEDVLQQAYLDAFAHLHQFQARARLSTWLTRIVINEACARRRTLQRMPLPPVPSMEDAGMPTADTVPTGQPSPEHQAYASELHRVLEGAIDTLPDAYRIVFVLRDVEGMSTSEAGTALELGDEAVKTRLHRARAMLRREIASRVGDAAGQAFPFHAPRCDRVVAAVMTRIGEIAAHAYEDAGIQGLCEDGRREYVRAALGRLDADRDRPPST